MGSKCLEVRGILFQSTHRFHTHAITNRSAVKGP